MSYNEAYQQTSMEGLRPLPSYPSGQVPIRGNLYYIVALQQTWPDQAQSSRGSVFQVTRAGSKDNHIELPRMDPKVPPQLVSLLSMCSFSIPDGKSHPEDFLDPSIPNTTCNTGTIQQGEMTVVSLDVPELSIPRQAPRKRGRPRKILENDAALTSKEVCGNLDHESFQRLIYRSAVDYKSSMHSVPTSLEKKQLSRINGIGSSNWKPWF